MAEGVEHLLARTFRAHGDAAPQGARELAIDFVVGAHAGWQMTHVRRYFEQPGSWQRRTLLVLSLCVWEQKHVQPGWVAARWVGWGWEWAVRAGQSASVLPLVATRNLCCAKHRLVQRTNEASLPRPASRLRSPTCLLAALHRAGAGRTF